MGLIVQNLNLYWENRFNNGADWLITNNPVEFLENEPYKCNISFSRDDNVEAATYNVPFNFNHNSVRIQTNDQVSNDTITIVFAQNQTIATVSFMFWFYPDHNYFGNTTLLFYGGDLTTDKYVDYYVRDIRQYLNTNILLSSYYLTYKVPNNTETMRINGVRRNADSMPRQVAYMVQQSQIVANKTNAIKYFVLDYPSNKNYLNITQSLIDQNNLMVIPQEDSILLNIATNDYLDDVYSDRLQLFYYYGDLVDGTPFTPEYAFETLLGGINWVNYPDLHNVTVTYEMQTDPTAWRRKSLQNYIFSEEQYRLHLTITGNFPSRQASLTWNTLLARNFEGSYFTVFNETYNKMFAKGEVVELNYEFNIPNVDIEFNTRLTGSFQYSVAYPDELKPTVILNNSYITLDPTEIYSISLNMPNLLIYSPDDSIHNNYKMSYTISKNVNVSFHPGIDQYDPDLTDFTITFGMPGVDAPLFPQINTTQLYQQKTISGEVPLILNKTPVNNGTAGLCISDNFIYCCGSAPYTILNIGSFYDNVQDIDLDWLGGNTITQLSNIDYFATLNLNLIQPITLIGDLRIRIQLYADLTHVILSKSSYFDPYTLDVNEADNYYILTQEFSAGETVTRISFNLQFNFKTGNINRLFTSDKITFDANGSVIQDYQNFQNQITENNLMAVFFADGDGNREYMNLNYLKYLNFVHCNYGGFGFIKPRYIYKDDLWIWEVVFHTSNHNFRLATVDDWVGEDQTIVNLNNRNKNYIVDTSTARKDYTFDLEYNPWFVDDQTKADNNYMLMRHNYNTMVMNINKIEKVCFFNDYASEYFKQGSNIKSITDKYGLTETIASTVVISTDSQESNIVEFNKIFSTNTITLDNVFVANIYISNVQGNTITFNHTSNSLDSFTIQVDSSSGYLTMINYEIYWNDRYPVKTNNYTGNLDGTYRITGGTVLSVTYCPTI